MNQTFRLLIACGLAAVCGAAGALEDARRIIGYMPESQLLEIVDHRVEPRHVPTLGDKRISSRKQPAVVQVYIEATTGELSSLVVLEAPSRAHGEMITKAVEAWKFEAAPEADPNLLISATVTFYFMRDGEEVRILPAI